MAESVARGYNIYMPSPLSAEAIRAALIDMPLIRQVLHHAAISSTNDLARQLASGGAPEIVLISADEQLAGRGRQGRAWYTPPGTALAISLLTRPRVPAQHAMQLTMLAGLAAVEGIEQATGLRLSLKWPNDIVSPLPHTEGSGEGRILKVGGILTETAFRGDDIEYAIVGLGLNVNVDFAANDELRDIAISLSELIGNPIDRLAVLRSIVTSFVGHYRKLETEQRLRNAWAARLINLGRDVRVQIDDRILEGRSEDVDHDGALLLRTKDGQVHRLLSGDVTLHRANA
jgi:BirA family biotin operon repressor/biotin-[acetyl-CoA-carboxylase] ligase